MTTLEELLKMEARERDKLTAQRVMGWTVVEADDCNGIDNYWCPGVEDACGETRMLPTFSTGADEDVSVLRHVRETWDAARFKLFTHHLWVILDDRREEAVDDGEDALTEAAYYIVGDYSLAALLSLEETQ